MQSKQERSQEPSHHIVRITLLPEDDRVVESLLSLHPLTEVDHVRFTRILQNSLSLDVPEKLRVIEAFSSLSQLQVDQLIGVFEEEAEEFERLEPTEGKTIADLRIAKAGEWEVIVEILSEGIPIHSLD
jgi:hypothetical protein